MARSTDAADPDKAAERIDLEKVLDHHTNNSVTSSGLCLGCLADGLHRPAPCETWLLARRTQLAEEQLALLPKSGQSVLRGFHEGAHDLGPRPSQQTAPRRPQQPEPDFGRAISTGSTPRIGSFDDDIVDAEIIED